MKSNLISKQAFNELIGSDKKAKYCNQKHEVNGIKFDSKKEAEYYKTLMFRKQVGEVINIELQPKFPYEITYSANDKTYKRKAFYKADFKVILADNTVQIIDVKGFKTETYKRKKRIIEALYDFVILER